jgi:hypothetical protein
LRNPRLARYSTLAMQSISTLTSLGSRATSTVARIGALFASHVDFVHGREGMMLSQPRRFAVHCLEPRSKPVSAQPCKARRPFMPWTYYSDDRGRRWRINQLGMWLLVRQHVYNSALCRGSHIKRVPQRFGPDEVSVEMDFQGSAAERDRLSAPLRPIGAAIDTKWLPNSGPLD